MADEIWSLNAVAQAREEELNNLRAATTENENVHNMGLAELKLIFNDENRK